MVGGERLQPLLKELRIFTKSRPKSEPLPTRVDFVSLTKDQLTEFQERGVVIARGILEYNDLQPVIDEIADFIEFRALELKAAGKIDDLKPLLNNAHIVLHTSLVEGIPRALMEAMARGKTILAADIPGMNELIQERVSGYLFDSDSLLSLIERMKFVVREKAFLPSLQVRGHITENFNPRLSGEQTLGAFQSMLFAKEGK